MTALNQREPPDEKTVAAYLGHRLSAARAEDFEAYCLRHPDFARRVELDSYLKLGLRQIGDMASGPRSSHRRRVVLALAASVMLAAVCGLLLHRSGAGGLVAYRSSAELPRQLVSAERVGVTLMRLRGAAPVYRVVPRSEAELLLVRIAPDSPPGPAGYAMTVAVDSPVSRSFTLNELRIDEEGYVEGFLPLASVLGQTVNVSLTASPRTGADRLSFQLYIERPSAPASAAASGPRA